MRDLPTGVYRRRDARGKPFLAQIHSGARTIHLGYFATPEEASRAVADARGTAHPRRPRGCGPRDSRGRFEREV